MVCRLIRRTGWFASSAESSGSPGRFHRKLQRSPDLRLLAAPETDGDTVRSRVVQPAALPLLFQPGVESAFAQWNLSFAEGESDRERVQLPSARRRIERTKSEYRGEVVVQNV